MGDQDELEYLSPEWLAALDEALRADDGLRAATAGHRLVVEQVVEVADGPAVAWQVRLIDGEVGLVAGTPDEPTVRFTTDRSTAEAITRGWEPAQAAFLRGDLRIGGDTAALSAQRDLLAGIEDAAAPVRDRTRYPSRSLAAVATAEPPPAAPPPPLPRRGRR